MPDNFLTNARLALLKELRANATLNREIRTWHEFGPGLKRRIRFEPVDCPFLILGPADSDLDLPSNVVWDHTYDLIAQVGTDTQDVAQLEELIVEIIDIVKAAMRLRLNLTSEGVTNVTLSGIRWDAYQTEKDARLIWTAEVTVRIHWKQF